MPSPLGGRCGGRRRPIRRGSDAGDQGVGADRRRGEVSSSQGPRGGGAGEGAEEVDLFQHEGVQGHGSRPTVESRSAARCLRPGGDPEAALRRARRRRRASTSRPGSRPSRRCRPRRRRGRRLHVYQALEAEAAGSGEAGGARPRCRGRSPPPRRCGPPGRRADRWVRGRRRRRDCRAPDSPPRSPRGRSRPGARCVARRSSETLSGRGRRWPGGRRRTGEAAVHVPAEAAALGGGWCGRPGEVAVAGRW